MLTLRKRGAADQSLSGVTATALAVSLIASAYLMAVAIRSPQHPWAGYFTLFPLFVTIRVCRPVGALLWGAVWGLSLWAFSAFAPGSGVPDNLSVIILLPAIPAIYACLGSKLTRWIGFSPFVLGVGWMGVELAFRPLGLQHGLLGGVQGGGLRLHRR